MLVALRTSEEPERCVVKWSPDRNDNSHSIRLLQIDRRIGPKVSLSIKSGTETSGSASRPDALALRRISPRAVALGLALTIPNTYWITVIEVRWYTLDGTSLPLF